MKPKLRWGILGTGSIARTFADAILNSKTGELAAVGSRTAASAHNFAGHYPGIRAYDSYEKLLRAPEVEAVYISVPHPMHAEWAVRAAEAGKHILCEKPLAMSHAEALTIIEAARRHDVFLMEAFMYRCHPQTRRVVELIQRGVLGEIKLIQASFGFQAPYRPDSRLYAKSLGGGGVLDVGCYCMSMARLIAGVAEGSDFLEPTEINASGVLHPVEGTDLYAAALMTFPNQIVAQLSCGVGLKQENAVRIFGSQGWMHIPDPWIPARDGGTTHLVIHQPGQDAAEISIQSEEGLYSIEADVVAESIPQRQASVMSWDDSLGNMKALDAWRKEIGLDYQ